MALCATTALAGAVPRLCVRGARGGFGGFGPVPGVVSLSFPSSRPACSALRAGGRPVRVSLTLARWYAIPRGLCVPRARSGCPSGDAFPWGGLATGRCGDTHRQAGRQSTALTGASLRSCHETKRFRILATLKQGNKSMYSNTSGYVHMGLRLDWGKGITEQ